jgi:hypothetical protein
MVLQMELKGIVFMEQQRADSSGQGATKALNSVVDQVGNLIRRISQIS